MCPTTKIDWVTLKQSESIKKTRRIHREPLGKTTSGLQPPRWKTIEIDLASLRQSESTQKPRPRNKEPLGKSIRLPC